MPLILSIFSESPLNPKQGHKECSCPSSLPVRDRNTAGTHPHCSTGHAHLIIPRGNEGGQLTMNVQVFQQWEGAWGKHVNSTSRELESNPQPSCCEATEPSNVSCPLVL